MRRHLKILKIAAAAFGVGATACAADDEQPARMATAKSAPRPDAPRPDAAGAPRSGTRETVVSGGEVVADSAPAIEKGVWLNDANLLALLRAMSVRQKAAADLELQSWQSDTVRAFAAAMWRDHVALQHSIDSVAASLELAPVLPALAGVILPPMQVQIDSLYGRGGKSLERAFVRQQAAGHESMAKYAAQLAAVAERPEVEALMSSAAARVGSQADRAKALNGLLAKADSLAAAASADSTAKLEARRKRQARRIAP